MHRIYFFLILILLIYAQSLKAQIPEILNKSYANLKGLKTISYRTDFTDENPFNPGDISKGIIKTKISYDRNGVIDFMFEEMNKNFGQITTREIYQSGKRYTFDLADSTFAVDDSNGGIKNELQETISGMLTILKKEPLRIIQKKDTLLNAKSCYQFFVKTYDTINNGNHDYTFRTILVDKKSLMPVYYKETGAGTAFKGGYQIGRLKFFIEKRFTEIKINDVSNQDEIKVNGFHEINKNMLRVGEKAPLIDAIPIANDNKNKREASRAGVKLVVFGSTNCSANPLSNPMLNKIQLRYADQPFSIVNIYTGDKVEQIASYVKNNQLKFPVFFGTRILSSKFKTVGTPNFYLIDFDGKVAASVNGFYDALEKDLVTKIDTLLKPN